MSHPEFRSAFRHNARPALRLLILPAALALCGLTLGVLAQHPGDRTCIPANTTFSKHAENGLIIGYANVEAQKNQRSPTSPTVRIVKGATIGAPVILYNGSSLAMSGGEIKYGGVTAENKSTALISGGTLGYVDAEEDSVITVKGGSIESMSVTNPRHASCVRHRTEDPRGTK